MLSCVLTMPFEHHVLKLLVMIVKMLMEAKCTRTGSDYEFVGENRYLREVGKDMDRMISDSPEERTDQ